LDKAETALSSKVDPLLYQTEKDLSEMEIDKQKWWQTLENMLVQDQEGDGEFLEAFKHFLNDERIGRDVLETTHNLNNPSFEEKAKKYLLMRRPKLEGTGPDKIIKKIFKPEKFKLNSEVNLYLIQKSPEYRELV
jgi:hypothetical protein